MERDNPTVIKPAKMTGKSESIKLKPSLVEFIAGQMSRKKEKSYYEINNNLAYAPGKPMEKQKIDEMIDDTMIDDIKLIRHLSHMDRLAENYTEYVRDKNSNFKNVK